MVCLICEGEAPLYRLIVVLGVTDMALVEVPFGAMKRARRSWHLLPGVKAGLQSLVAHAMVVGFVVVVCASVRAVGG